MMDETFWPSAELFTDLSGVDQLNDGRALCTGFAVCDATGALARGFVPGQVAHFFYEFAVLADVGMPSGGLEFCDAEGRLVHGKNTFQYGATGPSTVRAGERLRFHQAIRMDVAPGDYWLTFGLASTEETTYRSYREQAITHHEFTDAVREHCRATRVAVFAVLWGGHLPHHGAADLPGESRLSVAPPGAPAVRAREWTDPTIVHVTHWKAGSQWIHKILQQAVPDRVVYPQAANKQFAFWPLQKGRVYPTVYMTKQMFDRVRLPEDTRYFVIIRDLRDTLISGYFSIKNSHPLTHEWIGAQRSVLRTASEEEGLFYIMDTFLHDCARIQVSWIEAGHEVLRYEDLLEHDLEVLEPLLLDRCRLPVSRERFREVVLANRFKELTGGRERGQEDAKAHERKGVAGDWRNHFTDEMKRRFKLRYGSLLVATGYEKDLDW